MTIEAAIKFVDSIEPRHDRSTCSDEGLYNAAYGPDDHGGHGRCRRCTLLKIARLTIAEEDESEEED